MASTLVALTGPSISSPTAELPVVLEAGPAGALDSEFEGDEGPGRAEAEAPDAAALGPRAG